MHVLVRDLNRYQELGSVRLSSKVWQTTEQPVQNVLERAFLTVNDVSAVARVEVTWVP